MNFPKPKNCGFLIIYSFFLHLEFISEVGDSFREGNLSSGNLPSSKLSPLKLPFWKTVLLGNCPTVKLYFYETNFWEPAFRETVSWESTLLENCPPVKLTFWENFLLGNLLVDVSYSTPKVCLLVSQLKMAGSYTSILLSEHLFFSLLFIAHI